MIHTAYTIAIMLRKPKVQVTVELFEEDTQIVFPMIAKDQSLDFGFSQLLRNWDDTPVNEYSTSHFHEDGPHGQGWEEGDNMRLAINVSRNALGMNQHDHEHRIRSIAICHFCTV